MKNLAKTAAVALCLTISASAGAQTGLSLPPSGASLGSTQTLPSTGMTPEQTGQMLRVVGFSMGGMPTLLTRCNATADQRRRFGRVLSHLRTQVISQSTAAIAADFDQGVELGKKAAAEQLSKLTADEVKSACNSVRSSLEAALQNAEKDIPASFEPAAKVGTANRPKAPSTKASNAVK